MCPHSRTQPQHKGAGSQQQVADVPQVGVQVVEQRLPRTADEAAVQAAHLGTELPKGTGPAAPLCNLQTGQASEQLQRALCRSSAHISLTTQESGDLLGTPMLGPLARSHRRSSKRCCACGP